MPEIKDNDSQDGQQKKKKKDVIAAVSHVTRKKCLFCDGNFHIRNKCLICDVTCCTCRKRGYFSKVCRFKLSLITAAVLHDRILLAITSNFPPGLADAVT